MSTKVNSVDKELIDVRARSWV